MRLALSLALACVAVAPRPSARAQATPERPALERARAEVVRVIDGDTLEVLLAGERATLRLSSVDTEEKISGRARLSPGKPETVFGQETALWAQDFFARLGPRTRVELLFPEGRRRDAYGRLLGHVLLADGRDFNLLLVELGKSPYFNKYGNSPIAHERFVRAQDEARERELGIWHPDTNRARTSGVPSAVRPYAELLPWWNARAEAIERFRRTLELDPEQRLFAEDPAALARAAELCRRDAGASVVVFGCIERFQDEDDGSLTVVLRGADPEHAPRVLLPPARRRELERPLRASCAELRQNYWLVEARVERDERGFALLAGERSRWRTAEPEYPPAAPRTGR